MTDIRDVRIALVSGLVTRHTGRLAHEGVGNAHTSWHTRTGLLVWLREAGGAQGVGEASPLPRYSPDTIEQTHAALDIAVDQLRLLSSSEPIGLHQVPAVCARIPHPAARFAVETALFDVFAHVLKRPMAQLLAAYFGHPMRRSTTTCALIGTANERHAFNDAVAHAYERGIRCIKVKIGKAGRFDDELACLRDIRARYGRSLRVRLDVNRAWTHEQAVRNLAMLAEIAPAYVEEPAADLLALGHTPVPLAADESLVNAADDYLDALLDTPSIAAFVLKPMVLGGLHDAIALARRAYNRGVAAIVSHVLDGPVALAMYTQLSLILPNASSVACGLDRHLGLSAWPADELPHFGEHGTITYVDRTGLGIDLSGLPHTTQSRHASSPGPTDDDSDEGLRISRQAVRHSDTELLLDEQGTLTYAELDECVSTLTPSLTDAGALPLVATRTRAAIAHILYALDRRIPLILLHPRVTLAERESFTQRCRAISADGTLAAVLFTSGSSGQQKGVLMDRAAFIASAAANTGHLGWRDDDRWLCCLPLAHIGGLSIITRCLQAGRTIVLSPEGSFDPACVQSLVTRHRVTLISLVPTMLFKLLEAGWSPPAHVRAVLIGGASTPRRLIERARARGVPTLVTYGMTETCSQISTQSPDSLAQDQPLPIAGYIGPPLQGVDIDIRAGRLFVRGPMLCRRYLQHPCPIDNHGFFDTGDRAAIDDAGHLHVYGRADDTIITGGENVDPTEVEHTLIAYPTIAAACVFGVDDPIWGQQIAAVVVPQPGQRIHAIQLADFLSQRLPAHKRPRLFCQVDELAESANHKVSRRQVAAMTHERLVPLKIADSLDERVRPSRLT